MTTEEHPGVAGDWVARLRAHPRFLESRGRPPPRRAPDPVRDAPRRVLAGLALLALCPVGVLSGIVALYGLVLLVGTLEPEALLLCVPFSVLTAVTVVGGRAAWRSLSPHRGRAAFPDGIERRGARVLRVHRLGGGRGQVELELTDGTRRVRTARLGLARALRGAEVGIAHLARGTLVEFDVLLRDGTALVTRSPRDPPTPRWIEMA